MKSMSPVDCVFLWQTRDGIPNGKGHNHFALSIDKWQWWPKGGRMLILKVHQLYTQTEAGCSQEEGPKKGFVMGSRTQGVQEILEKCM